MPITFFRKVKSLLHRNSSIYRYTYTLKNKLFSKIKQSNSENNAISSLIKTRLIYNLNKDNKFMFDQNIANIKEFAKIAKQNKAKLIIATTPNNKSIVLNHMKNPFYLFIKIKNR